MIRYGHKSLPSVGVLSHLHFPTVLSVKSNIAQIFLLFINIASNIDREQNIEQQHHQVVLYLYRRLKNNEHTN